MFGETSDPSEAGYILRDGTMLDFTRGPGEEQYDHHAIRKAFGEDPRPLQELQFDFISRGNVRIVANPQSVQIQYVVEPTPEQRQRIRQAVGQLPRGEGHLVIERTHPEWHRVGSQNIQAPKVGDVDVVLDDLAAITPEPAPEEVLR